METKGNQLLESANLNRDVPKSNIADIWTPIHEWYVIKCGIKKGRY